jgi:hypothetical protein
VELPIFPAGIHARGQLLEKRGVILPAGELGRQDVRVHANHQGPEAQADEALGCFEGRAAPEREQAPHPRLLHPFLPVLPYFLQEEISEGDGSDAPARVRQERAAHQARVGFVRAVGREEDLLERMAQGCGLGPEEAARDAVHGDPVPADRRQERRNLDGARSPEFMKGQGGVLPAAPAEEDRFFHGVSLEKIQYRIE